MRTSLLTLVALAASAVNASPLITKRDTREWDPKGNLKLTFSKETVKIGDVSLDEMTTKLFDVCHTTGLCETNEIEYKGRYFVQGIGKNEDITVKLGPHGSYPTWIRNGLVDTLKAAVMAGAKCEEVTNYQANQCFGNRGECTFDKATGVMCEVPKFWGVTWAHFDEHNAAPPFISVDVEMESSSKQVCEDMMTMIKEIAGAVNGVAGGFATLLSLTCT